MKWMMFVTRTQLLGILLYVAGASTACSDDDGRSSASGGVGGAGRSDASTSGTGGGGNGASIPANDPVWSGSCDPSDQPDYGIPDPGDDECLKCLATACCSEIFRCGSIYGPYDDAGVIRERYSCYDDFFDCTRTCFERETAADASTDADDLLVACGRECDTLSTKKVFDYVSRDLLACVAGQPRPIPLGGGGMNYREGEGDADAGADEPNCIADCLPGWR